MSQRRGPFWTKHRREGAVDTRLRNAGAIPQATFSANQPNHLRFCAAKNGKLALYAHLPFLATTSWSGRRFVFAQPNAWSVEWQ
jgi:hypothetical protein